MNTESKELRERISKLPDEELLKIVNVAHDDYRKEALDYARDELSKRGVPLTMTQQTIPPATASPKSLCGFGGWLLVFLIGQFMALLMPILRFLELYGEGRDLSAALRLANLTVFSLAWNGVGLLLAFALLFPPHKPFVIWLVRGFLVANIGILIAAVMLYGSTIRLIAALIFSFIWLVYFFVSERVKATYSAAS